MKNMKKRKTEWKGKFLNQEFDITCAVGYGFMVLNASFNSISVISW